MDKRNRTIEELLVDYADSLRDGSLPTFLKSLTREEGRQISTSSDFQKAAEMVRDINAAGFAQKSLKPDVGLFISRVDAEIASRIKKARAPERRRHRSGSRSDVQRTEEQK